MSDFVLENDRITKSLQKCKFMTPQISCKIEYGEIQVDIPASKEVPVDWYITIITQTEDVRIVSRTAKNSISREAADMIIENMSNEAVRMYWSGSQGLTLEIRVPNCNMGSENAFVSNMDILYGLFADVWKLAAEAAGITAPESFDICAATVKECVDNCRFDGKVPDYLAFSDGDIRLNFPQGSKVTAADWFIWLYTKKDHITFESGLWAKDRSMAAPVADYCDKMEGITVTRDENLGTRLSFRIENSVVTDGANLVKRIEAAYALFRDLWSMAGRPFKTDTATVKECLTGCSFMGPNVDYTVDSDGDIRIDVSSTGSNPAKWFCWCYIHTDHLTFDTGSSNIPASFEKEIAESMKSGDGIEVSWDESKGLRIKATYTAAVIHNHDELGKIINDRLTNYSSFWTAVGNGYAEIQDIEAREKRAQAEQARKAEQARQAEETRKAAENAARIDPFMLSFDGDDEIRTVMKKFNSNLPYLRLGFYMVQTGHGADKRGGSISAYDRDTLFKKIHSFKGGSYDIDIDSRTTPADLEKMFRSQSGLVVKVCYTDDEKERYYISKDSDYYKMTLGKLNSLFDSKGYYYNDWY
ncbi:MAG: cell envelope integrity protein TolA [Bacteroidales bacterium]|nr:cell envelope integrity protein TolA [Bacteroidales bacterium]